MPKQLTTATPKESQPINGPTLDWLVDHLGLQRTYELINQFAYSPIFIPANRKNASSTFCKFVNEAELSAFQKEWAGTYIQIPLAKDFRCRYMLEVLKFPRREVARRLQIKTKDIAARLSRNQPANYFGSDKTMEPC